MAHRGAVVSESDARPEGRQFKSRLIRDVSLCSWARVFSDRTLKICVSTRPKISLANLAKLMIFFSQMIKTVAIGRYVRKNSNCPTPHKNMSMVCVLIIGVIIMLFEFLL